MVRDQNKKNSGCRCGEKSTIKTILLSKGLKGGAEFYKKARMLQERKKGFDAHEKGGQKRVRPDVKGNASPRTPAPGESCWKPRRKNKKDAEHVHRKSRGRTLVGLGAKGRKLSRKKREPHYHRGISHVGRKRSHYRERTGRRESQVNAV